MVVNHQTGGLGKTLFEASFCVIPNSLLGKENKNSVICFAFLSILSIFALQAKTGCISGKKTKTPLFVLLSPRFYLSLKRKSTFGINYGTRKTLSSRHTNLFTTEERGICVYR